MIKLELLLVVLVLLQYGLCNVRDQRHTSTKLHYIQKCVQAAAKEIDNINPKNEVDKEALQVASQNFVSEGEVCIDHLNLGIVSNTRNNEPGRNLQGYLQNAVQYFQWLQGNLQKDNNKLQLNFKTAVLNFEPFVAATEEVFAKIKQSSKNNELAVNSIMDSLDNGFSYFVKLEAHMKNRKSSNTDLHKKIKQVMSEAFNNLNEISSGPYNTNELVIYFHRLKYLVHKLSGRINSLLKSSPQQGEFKTIIVETVKKLRNVEDEIQNKGKSKLSLSLLQNMYKSWLNDILDSTGDLDRKLKGNIAEVKTVIFDTLGIAVFFKTVFEILAGKIV